MGSGTTAVAAVKEGRRFVGFEADKGYCETAMRRLIEPDADATGTVAANKANGGQ